jgi:hypothetical protein
MKRSLKQKVAAGAAVAVVLAGGSIAAVSATGQGSSHARSSYRRAAHPREGAHIASATRHRGRTVSAAASYLGLTTVQVQSDLRSGRTLAQIADATSGKSAAGLIEALVAAQKRRLAKASANLTRRVTAEVDGSAGPDLRGRGLRDRGDRGPGAYGAGSPMFAARGALALAAYSYLGVSSTQLYNDLRSGQTLAQVADATSGKSAAGLVSALVGARREQLAVAVAAGLLTRTHEEAMLANLPSRITALVDRASARNASRVAGAASG